MKSFIFTLPPHAAAASAYGRARHGREMGTVYDRA